MANVLKDEKKQQIIALGRLGWSLRKIQETTRVRRETISVYLRGAGVEIWPPGRWKREGKAKPAIPVITGSEAAKPAIPESGDQPNFSPNPNPENLSTKGKAKARTAKPANESAVTTGFGVELSDLEHEPPQPVPSISLCEAFRDAIELGLSQGRNAMGIWQDLVSESGFNGGYQTVKRFVRKLRGNQPPQPRAVIITAPGEESQVDYGTGPMVRHARTRKYRRTRLFVLTLGYSRKAVRLLTFQSSSRIWTELHEQAFRRLGGSTRIVVLDNLKEGVLVPDIYDPTLNPLYRDVLTHYGCVALPCRIQDPDRKGKVERGVGHAKNTPLKGKRFESLEEAQAIWIVGKPAAPIPASTAPPNGKSPPCLPKKNRSCSRCPWNRSATTSTANASCILTVVSKSRLPTTAYPRAGSVA
jgi:transposase